jgi:hypothetical protein
VKYPNETSTKFYKGNRSVLAYIFWHRPHPQIEERTYEESIMRFYGELGNHPPPGFLGASSFAIGAVPWLGGERGYEDWCLLEGSWAMDPQRVAMKLVAEYRKLAEEYRRLSNKLTRPKDKEALELMARAWDKNASKREDRLRSHAMRELLGHVHQQTVRESRFTLPTPPDNVLSVFHRRCLSEPTRQSASFGGTSSTIVPR